MEVNSVSAIQAVPGAKLPDEEDDVSRFLPEYLLRSKQPHQLFWNYAER
jgi:hypothetical protein